MAFAVFSDEGIVADDFQTAEEAREWMLKNTSRTDGLEVEEVCHDHPDRGRKTCECCNGEEE